ncbi:phosphoserine phosphatase SerB, partial [Jatrophihabitans endophyticus]|uniref:phosphoserine phosphatase SerB n=1 Tax=Jatrophihabitans endophyticus TaxID=1206085 RepID=UPI0019ECA892
VDVRDVEQVVVQQRLIMAVLLELRGDPAALRNSVSRAAHGLQLESEVTVLGDGEADDPSRAPRPGRAARSHVIVLGRPLRPGALGHVTSRLADLGANIESIRRLSSEPVQSLELIVTSPDQGVLRSALVEAAEYTGLDIAVEPAGLRRRAKRLVVLDVDSTLIQDETIDALGARAGVGAQIEAITARAMAGELDFAASLRARVGLLAGLPVSELDVVREAVTLTPGARTFVRTLRRVGFHVGVVSGGFTFVTDRLVAELGLDFAAANELEIADGVLTGRVVGDVVDRPGKAAALRSFAERFDIPLAQTVAVGDGANDIDMLEAAGLGVAFNAKAALRAAADTSVSVPYLDTVLFVLGISDEDVAEAAAP